MAQEGHAGAITPAKILKELIPTFAVACLFTRKIVIDKTIPARRDINTSKSKEIMFMELNVPRTKDKVNKNENEEEKIIL